MSESTKIKPTMIIDPSPSVNSVASKVIFPFPFQTYDDCVQKRDSECTNPVAMTALTPYFCGQDPACRSVRLAIKTSYLVWLQN